MIQLLNTSVLNKLKHLLINFKNSATFFENPKKHLKKFKEKTYKIKKKHRSTISTSNYFFPATAYAIFKNGTDKKRLNIACVTQLFQAEDTTVAAK